MLQQCVCRDIEHLGSLESTQKARVALSCASSYSYASFEHSKLPACDIRTLTHELIVKSCMSKICHAIRKQLVRQICVSFAGIKLAKTSCEQLSSSFCFVFLLIPLWF